MTILHRVGCYVTLTFVFLILAQALTACLLDAGGKYYSREVEQKLPLIRDVVVHRDFSEDVGLDVVPSQVQGTRGIGFVRPEHRDIPPFERPQTEEFRLALAEPFAPFLILLNNSTDPKVFMVTAILDYRQVPFELDGKAGLLHEVTVPPGTELEIPLRLDIDTPGAHDLQLAAFEDPYNTTLDLAHRMDLHGAVTARRAVVIVGKEKSPARSLEIEDIGVSPPDGVTFGLGVAFGEVSGSENTHPSSHQLYIAEADRGQGYPFQIWVSNYNHIRAADYAMVPFLNYHQTSLASKDLFVVHLEPGEEAVIETELLLPDEPGVHQFQMIWLFDPYHSVLRDEVFEPFVFGSPRIAINVK